MDHRRRRLGLVFGGRSREHEVSVVSARSVARAVARDRYELVPMAIDRRGRWALPGVAAAVLGESADRVDGVRGFEGVHAVDPRLLDGSVDVVFPVLHGPYGEDGTIQGMLEMLDLPYVGCDTTASAVCMDKVLTKRVLEQAGLATAPWCAVDRRRWADERDAVTREALALGPPLFVKPARLGSSVGVSKVRDGGGLGPAVEAALAHGERLLVERAIDGRELEVAVLGNDLPRASVPGEIVPGHEFYDYDDKYVDDACELLAPAPLAAAEADTARDLAERVYRLLGCEGMARVDLFLDAADGRLWVNEVNTIPGFTSISMYPRLWGVSGLDYSQLVDELIRLALERHARRR